MKDKRGKAISRDKSQRIEAKEARRGRYKKRKQKRVKEVEKRGERV